MTEHDATENVEEEVGFEEEGVEAEVINVEEVDGDEVGDIAGTEEESEVVEAEVVEEEDISRELTAADLGMEEATAEAEREEMKKLYANMQQGWFWFAKVVLKVNNSAHYEGMGYKTLKDMCTAEFPQENYTKIQKMLRIVSDLGTLIEAHISQYSDKPLPALESLYLIQTQTDRAAKIDNEPAQRKLSQLLAKVMDGSLSYHELRRELGGLELTGPAKSPVEVEEIKIEDGIEDVGESSLEEDIDAADIEIPDEVGNDVVQLSDIIALAIDPLRENCMLLSHEIEKDSEQFTEEVKNTIVKIDSLREYLDQFLTEIEVATN